MELPENESATQTSAVQSTVPQVVLESNGQGQMPENESATQTSAVQSTVRRVKRDRSKFIVSRREKRKLLANGIVPENQPTVLNTVKVKRDRIKDLLAKKDKRKLAKLVPATATQLAQREAYNKNRRDKYHLLDLEQRKRTYDSAEKLTRRIQRKFHTQVKLANYFQKLISEMQTSANKSYIEDQTLRLFLCTPKRDMISYLIGPLCNMDPLTYHN